jgi:NAD+ kinase
VENATQNRLIAKEALMDQAQVVASYLFHQEGMNVMVEPDVHDVFARLPGYGFM